MAKHFVLVFCVFASVVAFSTSLKCYRWRGDSSSKPDNWKEMTCSNADEVCVIVHHRTISTGKIIQSRGCKEVATCTAANTGDITPMVGKKDYYRLKEALETGPIKCIPCTTDLCNDGEVPALDVAETTTAAV